LKADIRLSLHCLTGSRAKHRPQRCDFRAVRISGCALDWFRGVAAARVATWRRSRAAAPGPDCVKTLCGAL